MWWFRKVLELIFGGISEFLGIVFHYPRAAIPVIMIVLGYIWYRMPSAPEPEKSKPVVVASKPSPSPLPAVVVEKPVEKLKPRPPEPSPVAPSRVPPEVEAKIPPEIREFMYKRLDQIKNGQPLGQPASLAKDRKITAEYDMGFLTSDPREYLLPNPTSRQPNVALICTSLYPITDGKPDMLSDVTKLPFSGNDDQSRYYAKIFEDIQKELTTPQTWTYRAMMAGRWAIFRVVPYPSEKGLLINALSKPPTSSSICKEQFGYAGMHRYYMKLTMTQ